MSTYSSGYETCNCFADAVPGYDGHLPSCPMFGAVPPSASEATPAVSSGASAFTSLEELEATEAKVDELVRNESIEDAANELDGIARRLLATCRSLMADRARSMRPLAVRAAPNGGRPSSGSSK